MISAAVCLVLFSGCRRAQIDSHHVTQIPAVDRDEFSVMTYNLDRFGYHDRDGDGQPNNPKPEIEVEAVIALIFDVSPDILALQEIGGPQIIEDLRNRLEHYGLRYDYVEYLRRDESELNMAVLSRYPIVSRRSKLEDAYTIGEARLPVTRGILDVDIEIRPSHIVRMMTAHLKSKTYHPLGQTEMRRNEARLLNNHVRHALNENPGLHLIVAGDMGDGIGSAALRTITGTEGEYLVDTRPSDSFGEIWTYFNADQEEYLRHDYILCSINMVPLLVSEKTAVIRHRSGATASTHRPVMAVFKTMP